MLSLLVVRYAAAFFVLIGAKLVLAVVSIYLLIPADRSCNQCDTDTLLIQPSRALKLANRFLFGRLQRRWCPRCGWEGLVRRGASRRPARTHSAGSGKPTVRH